MSSEPHEPSFKRKPPTAVPFTLIALGATAVIVPIILLRRMRGTSSRIVKDLEGTPPPIRRVPMVNSQATLVTARHAESLPEVARAPFPQLRRDVSEPTVLNRSSASGGLYALQALGIATCIVGASAVTGVLAIRWAMGVQTAEEFAARVRTKIQSLTPGLSSRIYRHHTDTSIEMEGDEPERVWAEVAQRLSKAYDEGGLTQWMAVAEKELEREAQIKKTRRTHPEEPHVRT